jgi:hypothetical protein
MGKYFPQVVLDACDSEFILAGSLFFDQSIRTVQTSRKGYAQSDDPQERLAGSRVILFFFPQVVLEARES